jgi:hypothetical protein
LERRTQGFREKPEGKRGKPEGIVQDIDGRIMLRRIFRKWHVRILTASSWLRIGTGVRQL